MTLPSVVSAAAKTWKGSSGGSWNTASNWTPSGVPAPADTVVIDSNGSVVVSGTAISFTSLTLGDSNGTNAASLYLSTGLASAGSVVIYKKSGLAVGTTQQLVFNGNFTMQAGSSMTSTAVTSAGLPANAGINIRLTGTGVFNLVQGGTITLSGLGFSGGAGLYSGKGSGGGGGGAGSAQSGGGGGGHGGAGGSASGGGSPGTGGGSYDTPANPLYPGSGGGGGNNNGLAGGFGGAGGGAFVLTASSITVNGLVTVNGAPGQISVGGGGGGAGGTINLTATYINGVGSILAAGGGGGTGTGAGGGGGGGDIDINASGVGNVCGMTFSVAGGTSAATAGVAGALNTGVTVAAPAMTSVRASSTAIEWDWNTVSGGGSYQVFSSTGGSGQSSVLGAAATSYLESALTSNTTFTRYVLVTASCGGAGTSSANLSTATLASPPSRLSSDYLAVYYTSAALQWVALPACEGYLLKASTAPDFTGTIYSSATPNTALSTLTISGLDLANTYYLQVGSLNPESVWNPVSLTQLHMQLSQSTAALSLGAMDPTVYSSTISISSFVVTNQGSLPVTIMVWASTMTQPSSPWTLGLVPANETVLLQGVWNSAAPSSGQFNTAITNSTTASTDSNYVGNQTGVSVPPGQSRTMWFQFWRPSSTVSNAKQSIQINAQAVYP